MQNRIAAVLVLGLLLMTGCGAPPESVQPSVSQAHMAVFWGPVKHVEVISFWVPARASERTDEDLPFGGQPESWLPLNDEEKRYREEHHYDYDLEGRLITSKFWFWGQEEPAVTTYKNLSDGRVEAYSVALISSSNPLEKRQKEERGEVYYSAPDIMVSDSDNVMYRRRFDVSGNILEERYWEKRLI
ncbi:hypothetical protein NR756_18420 [Alloalcanivorax xenomutans]|uniref:hypothetical protein n=1 Tax=Alloalcanivorax xenomutans TaxID=1094342 RepID=UPI003A7FFD59